MSSKENREQLFIGDRVRGLRRNPCATEPLPIEVGTEAKGTGCVQGNFEIRGGRHAGKQPKIDAMPRGQKLKPPLKIQMKFRIQADRVVPFTKTLQQIDHTTQEGTTGPHDLGSMMQVANEGLQITPGTPASTAAAPVKQRACPWGDGPPEPLSLTQCPKPLNVWTDQCTYPGEVEGLRSGRQLWKWLSSRHIG